MIRSVPLSLLLVKGVTGETGQFLPEELQDHEDDNNLPDGDIVNNVPVEASPRRNVRAAQRREPQLIQVFADVRRDVAAQAPPRQQEYPEDPAFNWNLLRRPTFLSLVRGQFKVSQLTS